MNSCTEFAADTTNKIIGCAIEVHRHLGPGLLESTYLRITGLRVGLILNFNRPVMIEGVRRVSLRDQESLRL